MSLGTILVIVLIIALLGGCREPDTFRVCCSER